jgi:hypothetical protein
MMPLELVSQVERRLTIRPRIAVAPKNAAILHNQRQRRTHQGVGIEAAFEGEGAGISGSGMIDTPSFHLCSL